jgi:hypothetical protein
MVAQVMATGLSLLVNVLVEVGGHHPYSPEQSGYGGWCWAARAVKFLVTVLIYSLSQNGWPYDYT